MVLRFVKLLGEEGCQMKMSVPDRFEVIRTLREDRQSKTYLANDHRFNRSNVIVRIIRKDHIQCERTQMVEHFSWFIGLQHSEFATVFDAGLTKQQHVYYVREH